MYCGDIDYRNSGIHFFRGKGVDNWAAEMSVRSTVAERGNISTMIVGTGTLENGESADVFIPTGIKVEKVLVENEDTVTKGQQLATLNEASIAGKLLEIKESLEDVEDEIDDLSSDANDSTTTEYLKAKVLAGEKAELEEAEIKLKKLLKFKKITASKDGIISGVYVEADTTISEDAKEESEFSGADSNNGNLAVKTTGESGNILFLNADTTGAENGNDSDESEETGNIKISNCSIDVVAPVIGAKPQTELGAADYFTGTISWDCSSETFQAETSYTATIKLTAKKGYEFSKSILPEVKGADVTSEVLESDSGESILRIKAKFTKTGKDASSQQGSNGQESGQSQNQAQENGQSQSGNGSGGSGAQGNKAVGSVSGNISEKGGTGASSGSGTGSSSGSTGSDASEASYSSYETAAFSIAEQDKTTVSINVDELDILSVEEGQTAEITLDALENQSFQGTITDISQAVSRSGKSTVMNIIGCLDTADEGEYFLDGQPVEEYSERELARIRNKKIGFVFQNFNLIGNLTAAENIELPLIYQKVPGEERKKRVDDALKKVGLLGRQRHKPNELSGGQQQRVAIDISCR